MVQIIDTLGQQRQAMAEALALLQRRQSMNEQSRQFQIEQQRAMDEAAQRERMQQQALDTSSQNTIAGKMPQAEFLSWYQRQSPEVKARYGNIDPSMFPNAQMEQTTTGQRLGIDNKLMSGQPLPFQAAGNPEIAKLTPGQQLERSQGGFLGYGGAPAATAMHPSTSVALTTPSKQQLAIDASTGAAPTAGEQLTAATQRRGQDLQAAIARQQQGLAGQYVTVTDTYGNIKGFFNPKTQQFVEPQGAWRKGAVNEAERTNAATAEGMLSDVNRVRQLFKTNPEAIGPAAGRWYDKSGKLLDSTPPAVTEIHQITGSLKQRLIYLKSGKQINEEEYRRLSDIMPNVFDPPTRFNVMLDRFETEMNQAVARNAALHAGSGGGGNGGGGGRKQVLDANGNLVWK